LAVPGPEWRRSKAVGPLHRWPNSAIAAGNSSDDSRKHGHSNPFGGELGGCFLVEGVGAERACDGTLSIPDLGKSQITRGHEPHA
ncbi:MAG: hypothetical protein O2919_08940, partial [Chloroflexi bacterium]|nr:hypothetical protein [Chloroflexota bacterium]